MPADSTGVTTAITGEPTAVVTTITSIDCSRVGASPLKIGKITRNTERATKEVDMKRTQLMKRAVVIGIVGAMAFCETVPSFATPVFSSTALMKTTAPDVIDQVRARRRGGGNNIAPAIALGMFGIVAGAIAQSQYNYGPGYYGPGYAPAPGYYGPVPGYYGPGPGYYGGPGYYPLR
jgi:hypothetical protein